MDKCSGKRVQNAAVLQQVREKRSTTSVAYFGDEPFKRTLLLSIAHTSAEIEAERPWYKGELASHAWSYSPCIIAHPSRFCRLQAEGLHLTRPKSGRLQLALDCSFDAANQFRRFPTSWIQGRKTDDRRKRFPPSTAVLQTSEQHAN